MSLRVGSVCSGVGGLDLGLHHSGMRHAFFCEIDPYRRRVLRRHWPEVPIHDDLSILQCDQLPAIDVLAGGTPCTDLSVAGQRAGLDGSASGLFWHFIRLRNSLEPEWTIWENVEGAFSSNEGLDFAQVLGALVGADCPIPAGGWGCAGVVAGPWCGAVWRLLDARYFGVPQRRRRVFVVARLGGACPPEVLLERSRREGDSAASASAREEVSAGAASSAGGRRTREVTLAATLTTRAKCIEDTFIPVVNSASAVRLLTPTERERLMGWPDGWTYDHGPSLVDARLARRAGPRAVAVSENQRAELRETTYVSALSGGGGGKPGQGYPLVRTQDEDAIGARWCVVDYRPDGRRCGACGDGVVAPVAEWIGRRLLSAVRRLKGD